MAGRRTTKPSKPARNADDIRKDITGKIIASLNSGKAPWRRPWSACRNAGFPTNVVSKNRYSGINPCLLELTCLEKQYASKWWGTYDQWHGLGGQVRKGEKGTQVVFYRMFEVDDPKNVKTGKKQIPLLRTYVVFNVDQVDGEKIDKYRATISQTVAPTFDETDAKELIAATGAKIHYGGNKAFYNVPSPKGTFPNHTGGDFIMVPHQHQFVDPAEFFVTQFHELAHWSEVRLNWEDKYAMGELVAEITACYLASELRVPNNNMENHNRYLQGWLSKMENDPKWIFQASTQASKVADFLLGFTKQKGVPLDSDETENEPEDDDNQHLEQAAA